MRRTSFAEVLEILVAIRQETANRPDSDEHSFLNHCLRYAWPSHGQFLQDLWVSYETKGLRGGYFVEFGAGDGVKFSNTCFLERELGWTGIIAEPARVYFPALREARTCHVDDRCVWTVSGERVVFNQAPVLAHSTIDAFSASDGHAASRTDGTRYEVETVSLNDLLAHWDAPRRIDYLSIDTEGSELAILEAFDFDRWDVRLISVEHNFTDKRADLLGLLRSKGYRRTLEELSNVDDWYVKII